MGITTPDAVLSFAQGGLTEVFTQTLTIAATGLTNKATIGTPLMNAPLPVIAPATGAFSGSFTIPGATAPLNRPAPFFGQIVRIGSITQGYGYFLLAKVPVGTESVTASPKLSGAVEVRTP